jgi:Alpha-L-arabinofuranosidase 1 domain
MRRSNLALSAGLLGLLSAADALVAQEAKRATLTIRAGEPGAKISRHLYGHFAEHLGRCIYDGLWVGPRSAVPNTRGIRNDVVQALRKIKIPNLRWPGGCFADQYHWQDGVGPAEKRPRRVNIHWGGVVEDNSFGTHEFLDFCEQIGADPPRAPEPGQSRSQGGRRGGGQDRGAEAHVRVGPCPDGPDNGCPQHVRGAQPRPARRLYRGDASGFIAQAPASTALGGGADAGGIVVTARRLP